MIQSVKCFGPSTDGTSVDLVRYSAPKVAKSRKALFARCLSFSNEQNVRTSPSSLRANLDFRGTLKNQGTTGLHIPSFNPKTPPTAHPFSASHYDPHFLTNRDWWAQLTFPYGATRPKLSGCVFPIQRSWWIER